MEELYFTEEHKMLRDMVREFAKNEVSPRAQDLDEKGLFPYESVKKMADLGLMGIPWDEKYGGTGMDTLALVIAIEEIGKACPSTAATMMAHTSLGTAPIALFGTNEQKEQYLPGLASGKNIGAFGLTEPNAGSDAGNTQTKAVLNGNQFIVNGEKAYCTNAGEASVIIFTAVIVEEGDNKGISAFVIDADTEGLSLSSPEKKMGWCASDTRSVFFKDMVIPKSAILGDPSQGFKQFLKTLAGGRITIGALGLGTAQGAFLKALDYSQEREAFGSAINKFQGVSFKLADMATEIKLANLMLMESAWKIDQNTLTSQDAAMTKLFCTEMVGRVSDEAIQICGGMGLMSDIPLERIWRDARIERIWEGTSEIQRHIISRSLLRPLGA